MKSSNRYAQQFKASRAGAKAAFSESAAWIAKYLPALNQWWRDRTDHPTDLDASSDRWEIEGVLDDVAEHCREAVPREAKPSWYAAALRDVKKIPHSRKGSMKSHFAVKKSVSGTLVNLVPKAKGAGWKSYYAEWPSAKDARVTNHGVLVERDDGRVTLTHTSGQVVSEGTSGFGSMSAIRMSRPGAKAEFNQRQMLTDLQSLSKRIEFAEANLRAEKKAGRWRFASQDALSLSVLYKRLHDLLVEIAQSSNMSRPGAKAAFSWNRDIAHINELLNVVLRELDAGNSGNKHRAKQALRDARAALFNLHNSFSRPGAKSNGLNLAQRIAVAHDAKRMALR